jgi:hypothetical protein
MEMAKAASRPTFVGLFRSQMQAWVRTTQISFIMEPT